MTNKTTAGTAEPHSNLRFARGSVALVLLWLLAGVAVALTLAIPTAFRVWGDNAYIVLAAATGLAALAATCVVERAPAVHALWLIVGVAVLLRGIVLFVDPLLSTDIYRYVWDGRVQAAGINPYRYFPAHDALTALRDTAIYPNINRVDYAVTIYPPVAQMFFFAVTRISEAVITMKAALLACEGVTVAVLVVLLRRIGRPSTRLVAYLWHPLPVWEIANSGHVDALMIALMMLGLWLAFAGRPLWGAGSIAFGALAKPVSLLALPALWRPPDWKMPLVVIAVVGLCYAAYLSVGWGALGFLIQGYLNEEGVASGDNVWPLQVWRSVAGNLPGDVIVYFAGGALLVAVLAFKAALRSQREVTTQLADINSLLLVSLFVLSPNYPWYFLVATPFVALCGGAPVWAMTLGALLLQEEVGWGHFVPLVVRKSLLYGVFIAACVYWFWRLRSGLSAGANTKSEVVDAQ